MHLSIALYKFSLDLIILSGCSRDVVVRNLKVMFFETLFYLVLLASVTAYAYNLQSQDGVLWEV